MLSSERLAIKGNFYFQIFRGTEVGPNDKCVYDANAMRRELELQSIAAVSRQGESLLPSQHIAGWHRNESKTLDLLLLELKSTSR